MRSSAVGPRSSGRRTSGISKVRRLLGKSFFMLTQEPFASIDIPVMGRETTSTNGPLF